MGCKKIDWKKPVRYLADPTVTVRKSTRKTLVPDQVLVGLTNKRGEQTYAPFNAYGNAAWVGAGCNDRLENVPDETYVAIVKKNDGTYRVRNLGKVMNKTTAEMYRNVRGTVMVKVDEDDKCATKVAWHA